MRVLSKSLLVAFLLLSAGLAVQDIATPSINTETPQPSVPAEDLNTGLILTALGLTGLATYYLSKPLVKQLQEYLRLSRGKEQEKYYPVEIPAAMETLENHNTFTVVRAYPGWDVNADWVEQKFLSDADDTGPYKRTVALAVEEFARTMRLPKTEISRISPDIDVVYRRLNENTLGNHKHLLVPQYTNIDTGNIERGTVDSFNSSSLLIPKRGIDIDKAMKTLAEQDVQHHVGEVRNTTLHELSHAYLQANYGDVYNILFALPGLFYERLTGQLSDLRVATELVTDYFAYKTFDAYEPVYFMNKDYANQVVSENTWSEFAQGKLSKKQVYSEVIKGIETKYSEYISKISVLKGGAS